MNTKSLSITPISDNDDSIFKMAEEVAAYVDDVMSDDDRKLFAQRLVDDNDLLQIFIKVIKFKAFIIHACLEKPNSELIKKIIIRAKLESKQ